MTKLSDLASDPINVYASRSMYARAEGFMRREPPQKMGKTKITTKVRKVRTKEVPLIRGSEAYWARRVAQWKKRDNPMTKELYLTLHALQKGECAICSKREKKLYSLQSDHDHRLQISRGLLCSYCNRIVLSGLRDNPVYIIGFVQYALTYYPGWFDDQPAPYNVRPRLLAEGPTVREGELYDSNPTRG